MKNSMPGKTLSENDWAFHRINEDERHAAFRWEISREVKGHGLPWLSLTEQQRREVVQYCADEPIEEVDIYSNRFITPGADDLWRHYDCHQVDSEQLHLFKIQWDKSNKAILASFEKWLNSNPSPKKKKFYRRNPGGRPKDFSNLVDLAIYRAVKRGYSRKEAIKILTPLLKVAEVYLESDNGKIGSKHWSKNSKSIEQIIELSKDSALPQIGYFRPPAK